MPLSYLPLTPGPCPQHLFPSGDSFPGTNHRPPGTVPQHGSLLHEASVSSVHRYAFVKGRDH
jgi:hypothetical protein